MKTDIYYFSATGNTLFYSKKLSEAIDNASIHSIPNIISQNIKIKGEIVGIVCPIYMHNMPEIVRRFVSFIESANYIFMIFTGAGELGNGNKQAVKLFEENFLELSALFNVPFPNNYSPYGIPSDPKQKTLFDSANNRIKEIVKTINNKEKHYDSSNTSWFKSNIFPGILYHLGYQRINQLDSQFKTEETCTACGLCEKLCPVNNIEMKDQKPSRKHQCQLCFACLQWCPQQAIQYGNKTKGVKRYHHPEIKLNQIIKQI